jgi:hypothetical protein
MIELLFLVAALAGFSETAKRRGAPGWPFILAAAVGFFLIGGLAAAFIGAGPHMFFSWGWVALTYASIFVMGGGGRRMSSTWQCPECRLYNPPSTIVCPCGYEPPDPDDSWRQPPPAPASSDVPVEPLPVDEPQQHSRMNQRDDAG